MATIYSQYDILKEVGAGGFSRVYKAQEKDSDEIVAIKVVGLSHDDLEMKEIVENEIRIMKAVNKIEKYRANFVQYIDELREPNRICVIMEYLHGGELFDRIVERQHYTENDACALMKKMIKAINALHKAGIVHRDLKPENLVYEDQSDDSEIKIMDFGLSWFMNEEDVQQSAQYVGTPGYIAPEILLSSNYGPEGDIWSLGVILYILLSGRMPFSGRTAGIQNAKIMSGTFYMKGATWKQVSPSAKDLIKRMLTVDPAKRITAPEVLKHKWMREDPIRRVTANLGAALTSMREFNDRRRIQAEVKKMLDNTTNDIRKNLNDLIEKNNPTGLTAADIVNIRNSLVDKNGGVQNPDIDRETFRQTFVKLKFNDMPVDEMWDVLIGDKKYQSKRDTRPTLKTSLISSEESTGEDLDTLYGEAGEPTLRLDEVIVGLSSVVAIESRDKLLHYLFDTFAEREGEKGITSTGLTKIMRVLASYNDPALGSQRKKVAARIGQAFLSGNDENDVATGPITYEEFSRGITTFGEDLFTAYFVKPVQGIAEAVENASSSYLGREKNRPVRKTLKYFKRAGTYIHKVSGKWSKEKKEKELERAETKIENADEVENEA